jgi:hypothetical protein
MHFKTLFYKKFDTQFAQKNKIFCKNNIFAFAFCIYRANENKFSRKCENKNFRFNPIPELVISNDNSILGIVIPPLKMQQLAFYHYCWTC